MPTCDAFSSPQGGATPQHHVLCLHDLTVFHDTRPVVQGLSCQIPQGCLVALMGPNGGGKSTLLRTLAGLHNAYTGQWGWCLSYGALPQHHVLHPPFKKTHRREMAYLAQNAELQRRFPITVAQAVAMGRWRPERFFGFMRPQDHDWVTEALKIVDLLSQRHTPIAHLSGGQMQRMLFARMLVQDAPLLFLDEPFSAMDAATVEILLAVVALWHSQGKTLVVAQHDEAVAKKHFPHTLLLARHCHYWGPSSQILQPEAWKNVYHALGGHHN